MDTEDNNKPVSQTPQLCMKGCGFYAGVMGLCSKCYNDEKMRNQQNQVRLEPPLATSPNNSSSVQPDQQTSLPDNTTILSQPPAAAVAEPIPTITAAAPPPTNACLVCKKRLGLTPFICDCQGSFCGSHRYSDCHNCTFDYRSMGAEKIRTANPQIVPSKINKI